MSTADDQAHQKLLGEVVARCLYEQEADGAAAVERACEQHPQLAADIRRRLAHLEQMGVLGNESTDGREMPEKLGDFRLLRRIGVGGMGVVYLAREESLERDVALKLVRPEHLYFPQARERFLREVRAVASLQHPGIVPVYSAGEESGVPYFAMEFVDGHSLSEILQSLHDRDPARLTGSDLAAAFSANDKDFHEAFAGGWVETCLRLTLQAAEALIHAHERNIIHRDIKPSNLMLTANGHLRLLDFGLASSSGGERITRTGAMVGSLPYMPAEALEGHRDQVDERSDVYSLGVTLYEMLTLQLPFQDTDWARLRGKILAGHIPPPRGINAQVSRDAETVCLTAMDRDPARRYSTATRFARDLRRVLELRPIEARRASVALRAKRWVQRHPTQALAMVLAILVVFVGPILFALQAGRNLERVEGEKKLAIEARKEAERQEKFARDAETQAEGARQEAELQRDNAYEHLGEALAAVDRFLEKVGSEKLKHVPQMEGLRRELLEDALSFYQRFYESNSGDSRVVAHTIRALEQVSLIQRLLGNYEEGSSSENERIHLVRERLQREPGNAALRLELSDALNALGNHERMIGQLAESQRHFEEAIEILRDLVSASGELRVRYHLAIAVDNLGQLQVMTGETEQAIDTLEEGRAILSDLIRGGFATLGVRVELSRVLGQLGDPLQLSGRLSEARQCYREAVALQEEMGNSATADPSRRVQMAMALSNLGRISWSLDDYASAEEHMGRAREIQEELVREYPGVVNYRWDLAMNLLNLGGAYNDQGKFADSESVLEQARTLQEKLIEDHPDVAVYKHELSGTLSNLAETLLDQELLEEAYDMFQDAIELEKIALQSQPDHPRYRKFLRVHYRLLAITCMEMGRDFEAVESMEEVIALTRKEELQPELSIFSFCCTVAEEDGRPEDAEAHAERLYELILECQEAGRCDSAWLLGEPLLDEFRKRADFQEFLRQQLE